MCSSIYKNSHSEELSLQVLLVRTYAQRTSLRAAVPVRTPLFLYLEFWTVVLEQDCANLLVLDCIFLRWVEENKKKREGTTACVVNSCSCLLG
jgi:hypothetical protein